MKKAILLFIISLTSLQSFSQVINCDGVVPFNQEAYTILKNLDKSQIPTGVLYESVFPFAELEAYTGTPSSDSSNNAHFLQAYAELYSSTFNRANILHISDFRSLVENFHPDKKYHHPIGIIDYAFNTISPNAVANNQLSVSNFQLYDVPGRSSSPYSWNSTSLAAPLMAYEYSDFKPGTHYLHFSSNFVLSNTGFNLNQVSQVQVKLNGFTIYNSYHSGINNLVVPINISNQNANMNLAIILQVGAIQKYYPINPEQVEEFTLTTCDGIDEINVTGDAFDGGYGEGSYSAQGKASIFYTNATNCALKKITKPIIFVDGFDAGNAQHAPEIWDKYLNKEFKDENNQNVQLGTELRANGYDLIIYDQVASATQPYNTGGGGLIENSALALEKFIETLYATHGSTIQGDMVIVAASMGGLTTRYALADMEKKGKNHHTRLFISFDSPQNGAQIPIGLQQLVNEFARKGYVGSMPGVSNALHNSSAAKQMLVNHASQNSEQIAPDPYRQRFLNNLAAVGNWPTQCRMIAIVDGNRVGIKKDVDPDGPDSPGVETIPAIDACGIELDARLKPFLNSSSCTLPSCYRLSAQVYAQTESSRCPTFEMTFNQGKFNLFLLVGKIGTVTVTKYAEAFNGTSFDIAPGARIRKDPLEQLTWQRRLLAQVASGSRLTFPTNVLKYSNFISTYSSVAYTYPNNEPFYIYKNFIGVNLSKCAGTTPMDTVYAGNEDLEHVAINSVIANAFRAEVYYPKPKSVCAGGCPDYLTLNTPLTAGNYQYKAAKAITLLPNFKADGHQPLVMKAEIGCANALALPQPPKNNSSTPSTTSTCGSFTWDQSRNNCVQNGSMVTFQVFATNMDISAYAEFSIDGSNFYKATVMDDGWEFSVPYISGGSQIVWARASDKRSNVIMGFLGHCN